MQKPYKIKLFFPPFLLFLLIIPPPRHVSDAGEGRKTCLPLRIPHFHNQCKPCAVVGHDCLQASTKETPPLPVCDLVFLCVWALHLIEMCECERLVCETLTVPVHCSDLYVLTVPPTSFCLAGAVGGYSS